MALDLLELAKEAQGIDPEIAAEMQRDAEAWKRQGRDTNLDDDTPEQTDRPRDENGRFTSQEQEGKPDADQAGDADEAKEGDDASQPTEKPQALKDGKPPTETETTKTDQQEKSKWAREQERKGRTWDEINKSKSQVQQEREQLDLERKQWEAQRETLTGQVKDESGFTAAEYQQAAGNYTQRAQGLRRQQLEADARGDFDTADRLGNEAGKFETLATKAKERIDQLSATGPNAAWTRLGQDLPEALQAGSPLFAELRKTIRDNPKLLADPFGPYRVAVQIGRKTLETTQAQLAKATTESAKVPGLEKQVAELSAKVKELTRLTSLTGDGGTLVREGSSGQPFEDLSLEQMEAQLRPLMG